MRLSTAAVAAMVFALTGCGVFAGGSDGPKASASPVPESARQVCDGALSASGARSLEVITGAKEFRSTVTQKTAALAGLLTSELPLADARGEEHAVCEVYVYKNWGQGLAPVTFSAQWETQDPGARSSTDKLTSYDVASGAYVFDDAGSIAFRCPFGGDGTGNPKLNLDISMSNGQKASGSSRNRADNLALVHSFAVSAAEQLGCLDSGNLPKALGTLKPYPVGN